MNDITTRAGKPTFSLTPSSIAEAIQYSEILANSDMVPKEYQRKPSNILVAVQWGLELGLHPLQALQNIATINGRPCLWGDAQLALVQGSSHYEEHDEGVRGEKEAMTGWCRVKRRGHEWHEVTFDMSDAKRAGLLGKAGPWTQYTQRMLMLRARGFALRNKFADVLKGMAQAEEERDRSPLDIGSGSTAQVSALNGTAFMPPDAAHLPAPEFSQHVREPHQAASRNPADRIKESRAKRGAEMYATEAANPAADVDGLVREIVEATGPDALTAAISRARHMPDGPEKDRVRKAYADKLAAEKARAAEAVAAPEDELESDDELSTD